MFKTSSYPTFDRVLPPQAQTPSIKSTTHPDIDITTPASRQQSVNVLDTPTPPSKTKQAALQRLKQPDTPPSDPPKVLVKKYAPKQRRAGESNLEAEIRGLKRDIWALLCMLVVAVAGMTTGFVVFAIAQWRINKAMKA